MLGLWYKSVHLQGYLAHTKQRRPGTNFGAGKTLAMHYHWADLAIYSPTTGNSYAPINLLPQGPRKVYL